MRALLLRVVHAATGDDGTGGLWKRLTPDGRAVLRLGFVEARELGHPCLGAEHVLLGLLRHGTSDAAALVRGRGLDLDSARGELLRVGPSLGPATDPAAALAGMGIEVEQVRRRLAAGFGSEAVRAAEWRVRRRPRWRGGHARPDALCVHLLANRSFAIATRAASRHGAVGIGPEHLLYGAVSDARDPLGTGFDRRSLRRLTRVGWTAGRPNPLRLILEARGIDLTALLDDLWPGD
ncbi:MAG: hypothetical protein GEV10_19380 [Streptosporangiales bacterium]|nr:hypothetical protein [Streptosporangiales bacterium]